jgi:hypothetical protein
VASALTEGQPGQSKENEETERLYVTPIVSLGSLSAR